MSYLRSLAMGWLIGTVLAGQVACAQSTPVPTAGDPFKWLTQSQLDALADTVPKPPALGSPEDKTDLTAILQAQQARTAEIEAECKRDQTFSALLFQPVYGNSLTRENSPAFYQLMDNVLAATAKVNGAAKDKYKRLRPYQGHPDVVHALFPVSGFSYPSGHSMASFTLATVLGSILPEKRPALLDRAEHIAQSRVDAGVHYPSDIKEGEVLGKTTGAAIIASPGFQSDLAEVKAELKL